MEPVVTFSEGDKIEPTESNRSDGLSEVYTMATVFSNFVDDLRVHYRRFSRIVQFFPIPFYYDQLIKKPV